MSTSTTNTEIINQLNDLKTYYSTAIKDKEEPNDASAHVSRVIQRLISDLELVPSDTTAAIHQANGVIAVFTTMKEIPKNFFWRSNDLLLQIWIKETQHQLALFANANSRGERVLFTAFIRLLSSTISSSNTKTQVLRPDPMELAQTLGLFDWDFPDVLTACKRASEFYTLASLTMDKEYANGLADSTLVGSIRKLIKDCAYTLETIGNQFEKGVYAVSEESPVLPILTAATAIDGFSSENIDIAIRIAHSSYNKKDVPWVNYSQWVDEFIAITATEKEKQQKDVFSNDLAQVPMVEKNITYLFTGTYSELREQDAQTIRSFLPAGNAVHILTNVESVLARTVIYDFAKTSLNFYKNIALLIDNGNYTEVAQKFRINEHAIVEYQIPLDARTAVLPHWILDVGDENINMLRSSSVTEKFVEAFLAISSLVTDAVWLRTRVFTELEVYPDNETKLKEMFIDDIVRLLILGFSQPVELRAIMRPYVNPLPLLLEKKTTDIDAFLSISGGTSANTFAADLSKNFIKIQLLEKATFVCRKTITNFSSTLFTQHNKIVRHLCNKAISSMPPSPFATFFYNYLKLPRMPLLRLRDSTQTIVDAILDDFQKTATKTHALSQELFGWRKSFQKVLYATFAKHLGNLPKVNLYARAYYCAVASLLPILTRQALGLLRISKTQEAPANTEKTIASLLMVKGFLIFAVDEGLYLPMEYLNDVAFIVANRGYIRSNKISFSSFLEEKMKANDRLMKAATLWNDRESLSSTTYHWQDIGQKISDTIAFFVDIKKKISFQKSCIESATNNRLYYQTPDSIDELIAKAASAYSIVSDVMNSLPTQTPQNRDDIWQCISLFQQLLVCRQTCYEEVGNFNETYSLYRTTWEIPYLEKISAIFSNLSLGPAEIYKAVVNDLDNFALALRINTSRDPLPLLSQVRKDSLETTIFACIQEIRTYGKLTSVVSVNSLADSYFILVCLIKRFEYLFPFYPSEDDLSLLREEDSRISNALDLCISSLPLLQQKVEDDTIKQWLSDILPQFQSKNQMPIGWDHTIQLQTCLWDPKNSNIIYDILFLSVLRNNYDGTKSRILELFHLWLGYYIKVSHDHPGETTESNDLISIIFAGKKPTPTEASALSTLVDTFKEPLDRLRHIIMRTRTDLEYKLDESDPLGKELIKKLQSLSDSLRAKIEIWAIRDDKTYHREEVKIACDSIIALYPDSKKQIIDEAISKILWPNWKKNSSTNTVMTASVQ